MYAFGLDQAQSLFCREVPSLSVAATLARAKDRPYLDVTLQSQILKKFSQRKRITVPVRPFAKYEHIASIR